MSPSSRRNTAGAGGIRRRRRREPSPSPSSPSSSLPLPLPSRRRRATTMPLVIMLLGAMLSATAAAATDGNNEFVDDMMLADRQAQMDAEQLNFEESEWEDGLEKEFTTMPVQEGNGAAMPEVAEEGILTFDDFIMTAEDDVLPRGDAQDYEDVQDYATAVGGTQKEEQQQQGETTNNNEEEGDKPNDVEAPRPEVEDNIESQQEKAQNDVVPRPEVQDDIIQEDQQGESQPRGVDVDEEGEVASDSTRVEEIDVEEAAQDLLKEAEEEEETQKNQRSNQTTPALTSANEIPADDNQQQRGYYPSSHKSAWLAHGAIGALVFGLLLPISISSAYFRDAIPAHWIYLHVSTNVMSFALTFLSVGVAFATMHGMGDAGEGHMKEMHHLAGLLLLMLVSFQTANGFLRPPREFVTDDEHDRTPGAVLRSSMNDKGLTARTLWHLVHSASGLFIFGLGAYQVVSGLGLFSKRYGTPDWGQAYVGYIGWFVTVVIFGKVWIKCKGRKRDKELNDNLEMQMGRGSNLYDPENDLTVAQFETV